MFWLEFNWARWQRGYRFNENGFTTLLCGYTIFQFSSFFLSSSFYRLGLPLVVDPLTSRGVLFSSLVLEVDNVSVTFAGILGIADLLFVYLGTFLFLSILPCLLSCPCASRPDKRRYSSTVCSFCWGCVCCVMAGVFRVSYYEARLVRVSLPVALFSSVLHARTSGSYDGTI